jgi:hypothetical protein
MPYKVQFVGLVCFLREPGGRHVLLPDGRTPDNGVDPHYASIIVARGAVQSSSGWEGDSDAAEGEFTLPPCSLSFEGADLGGPLDTSGHDGCLPELKELNGAFKIDPHSAQTIVRLHIGRGTLAAYQIPGGTAAISELEVPHDNVIHITVTPQDGSAQRSIVLNAGTEIALANTARGGYATFVEENGHFRIYEKLSAQPAELPEPGPGVAGLTVSTSQQAIFLRPVPIGLNTSCSNTGCCGG